MVWLQSLGTILMLASAAGTDPVAHAEALRKEGKLVEAAAVLETALEQSVGQDARLALILNNLANVSGELGKYDRSERLYQRCIRLWKELGMADTPYFARTVGGLIALYLNTSQFGKAEAMYRKELQRFERMPGIGEEEQARILHRLGMIAHANGQESKAEGLYLQALRLLEKCNGCGGTDLPSLLNSLAILRFRSGLHESSIELLARARKIVEEKRGAKSPELISILTNYGLYVRDDAESDASFARALRIAESTLGRDHPDTALVLESNAERLRKIGRKADARRMEARAKAIMEAHRETIRQRHVVDLSELHGKR